MPDQLYTIVLENFDDSLPLAERRIEDTVIAENVNQITMQTLLEYIAHPGHPKRFDFEILAEFKRWFFWPHPEIKHPKGHSLVRVQIPGYTEDPVWIDDEE